MARGLRRAAALGVALALGAGGCGYRWVPRGSLLPGGVRSVCAPVFANRTSEAHVEALFTQSLREELARAGRLGRDGACDARLEGEIVGLSAGGTLVTEPVFQFDAAGQPVRNPDGNVREAQGRTLASYRAYATVVLRLVRDGQVVAETAVSGSEDFLPGREGDITEAEAYRQAAIERLSDALMREGYDRLASAAK